MLRAAIVRSIWEGRYFKTYAAGYFIASAGYSVSSAGYSVSSAGYFVASVGWGHLDNVPKLDLSVDRSAGNDISRSRRG